MLKRIGPSVLTAGEASSPALFPAKLEFNPPAHGPWNIVHIGMLVPEAHQVYVCAVNCMRGVTLTAAEMGMADRFSCVVLKEEDITRGTVEEVTLEGIADVLDKLAARRALPPCVIVFPVCTHHFLGVSMGRVYRELRRRYPSVDFVEAWMDPIMKKRLSPDMRLRRAMYEVLEPCPADEGLVAHVGSDFALDDDCELRTRLAGGGWVFTDLQSCASYDDFKGLARAGTFISTYPLACPGIERLAKRLGRRHLYLPSCFDYQEIRAQHEMLEAALGLPALDIEGEIARCEEALAAAHDAIGDVSLAIDAAAHPRPLGLARLLLEHGFAVREVYLDGVMDEEAPALAWLREHAPEVELSSIVLPELRVAPRTRERTHLAIGPKAAWFTGTTHFVNIVEGAGLWGFAGIRTLAQLLVDAWEHEKDTRDLIPRKGLGCPSCF